MGDEAVSVRPRIVILGPSPGARGGIAQFSVRLRAALTSRAHVVTLSYARLYPAWTAAGRNANVGAPQSTRGDGSGPIAWRPWTWRRARREIARVAPDLLVIQWWHPLFGPVAWSLARSARRAGARTVVVCHNAQPHEWFPMSRWLTARTFAHADLIVAMSQSVRAEIYQLSPRARVELIEHPPNLDVGPPPDRSIGPPRAHRSILFFGTVRPYKGLEDLLEALPAVLAEDIAVRLTVAGSFFGSEDRYRAIVRRLGLQAVVDLRPGYVPDGDVGALLGGAELLVLPYRSASQSGILALAALVGTPIVATAVGGLPDALDENGVLVPPCDPPALAAGIVRALRSPPRAPAPPQVGWEDWSDALIAAITDPPVKVLA